MSKIRFLVGKPGDLKFKRNIPGRLQKLAGQTAFVERVKSNRASEIREQGHLFAVTTDASIRRLEAMLASDVAAPEPNAARFDLSEARVRQIAFLYFRERDRENLERGDYFASPGDPNLAELLSDAGEEALEALRQAAGEYRTTLPRAVKLLTQQGVLPEATSHRELPAELKRDRNLQFLCRLMERADVELAERRYRSLNRGSLAPIRDRMFQETEAAAPELSVGQEPSGSVGKTVADLKRLFLKIKLPNVTKSRAAQYRIPFRAVEERFGPKFLLAKIGREEARELLEFFPKIPAHVTQHYKKLTLQSAAEEHRKKHGVYADRPIEAQKHVQVLKSAFDLSVSEQWLARNPFVGLKVQEPTAQRKKHVLAERTYEPFSIDQLNRFFALPLFTGCQNDERGCHIVGPIVMKRHRYWSPILALWTGMRMNEILQLEKADVRSSESGIWYISVTDEDHEDYGQSGFSKRLKTANALRNIPIHPQLIEFGFVNWAQARGDGRLFPEAVAGRGEKPSDTFSKRFASNLKAAEVWKPRRLVFHSFRNSFNDALRGAGVAEELREAINGWTGQRSMDAKYGRGYTIETLHSAICRISYPGLNTELLAENARR